MWSVRERERSWITAGGLVGAKEGWTCLSNHVGDGGLQSRIVGKLRNYILDMRRVRCQLRRNTGWAAGCLILEFGARSELEIERWELSV